MLNVLPVFVGALAGTFQFSETQLGDLVASYNIAFTLVAISAVLWVRRFNWRATSFVSVGIAAAALMSLMLTSSYSSILLIISLVGLGSGAVYALIMAVLGDSDDPDRAYGLKLGLETLPGAALLFILPALVAPKYGFPGVVVCMAISMVLMGLPSVLLPNKGIKDLASGNSQTSEPQNNVLCYVSLLASLIYLAGLIATWAFVEVLAADKGLPGESIGLILSLGFLIAGGGGGFLAAFISDRFGRLIPFFTAVILNILALFQLSSFEDASGFLVGTWLFMFTINFGLTYTFGLTASLDTKGRLVVLSAATLSLGGTIGALLSGRLIESYGFSGVFIFSTCCMLASAICYFSTISFHKKNNA